MVLTKAEEMATTMEAVAWGEEAKTWALTEATRKAREKKDFMFDAEASEKLEKRRTKKEKKLIREMMNGEELLTRMAREEAPKLAEKMLARDGREKFKTLSKVEVVALQEMSQQEEWQQQGWQQQGLLQGWQGKKAPALNPASDEKETSMETAEVKIRNMTYYIEKRVIKRVTEELVGEDWSEEKASEKELAQVAAVEKLVERAWWAWQEKAVTRMKKTLRGMMEVAFEVAMRRR